MRNSELIQHNIDTTPPLTQEVINLLENKNYSSGRLKVPGDKLLFAFLSDASVTSSLAVINFHPEEYGVLYEAADPDKEVGEHIPEIKFKQQ